MTLVLATVKVVLYTLVGGYLLRKGETLMNWAGGFVDNSEERPSSSIEEIKRKVEEKQNLDKYLNQVSEQIETENRTS